jgi:hypothetical protein
MDSDMNREEDFVQSSPYHLVRNTLVWILQVLRVETCCLENFFIVVWTGKGIVSIIIDAMAVAAIGKQ